ncbi:hypothetical protein BASA81_003594 [Batrachochytrium salamandrivorans]|nr:hypothetical protein BASA81_003594 [Batrachochytrium salamandrivorans]
MRCGKKLRNRPHKRKPPNANDICRNQHNRTSHEPKPPACLFLPRTRRLFSGYFWMSSSVTLVRQQFPSPAVITNLSLRLGPDPAQSDADDGIPTPEPLGSSRILAKEKWWRSPEVTKGRVGNRLPSSPPFKFVAKPALAPPPPPPPLPPPRVSKYEVAVFLLCVAAMGATGNTVWGFSFSPLSLRVAVLSALCAVLSFALLVLCVQFLVALWRPALSLPAAATLSPPVELPVSYVNL